MPLYKEGLKTLRSQLKEILPSKALEAFDDDAHQLEKKYAPILKMSKGDTVPDFTLINAIGEFVNLFDLLQKGSVVLVFYRGNWCPYCNLQLNQYQQILEDIKMKGAFLIAISPQTPNASLSIKEKNELEYEVLSDNGNIVAHQFTTIFKNGDKPIQAMTDLGYDFDSFYGDDSREIPIPAVFIINQDRKVIFAKAEGGDYRNRVEPSEILKNL